MEIGSIPYLNSNMIRSLFFAILITGIVNAQPALYNSGNLRVHEGGVLGLHTDLINDGSFEDNQGLLGFYGPQPLFVTGAFIPVAWDLEIANDQGVDLDQVLAVENNTNFIIGDFRSPRNQPGTHLRFRNGAFTVGESDLSKVDGYVQAENVQLFNFPVGDALYLRSLLMNGDQPSAQARCAYFFEDPNAPSTFPPADTRNHNRQVAGVSDREFWRLEAEGQVTVSLSWIPRSELDRWADEVEQVVVMGWDPSLREWIDLGQSSVGGDLINGFVSSAPFSPADYELITLGARATPTDVMTLDNFIISPNGDGINDALVIEELAQSPNNLLTIFDRNGVKVFEKANYRDEFRGYANTGSFILKKDAGLPEGIYYYVLDMYDLDLHFQGFLYLERF